MFEVNKMFKSLVFMTVVVPCFAQGTLPTALVPWSFLPIDGPVKTADPVARVFGDRLYVYTALDHTFDCGPKFSDPFKREGDEKRCMVGYRAFYTNDASLQTNWTSGGSVLHEGDVPWAYQSPGFKGSGRMVAPDVVKGDTFYHLFFSTPKTEAGPVIGVAGSGSPIGKFRPNDQPIENTSGTDPSVIKLTNDQWVLFTSSNNGTVVVQGLADDFKSAGKPTAVTGLMKGRDDIPKYGLSTEYRSGKLYLYYTAFYDDNHVVRQAVAKDPENPAGGFFDIGVVINGFDKFGRSNKGSVVTYKGKSWAFYYRHVAAVTTKWMARRVAFSPMEFWCDGKAQPITPPTIT